MGTLSEFIGGVSDFLGLPQLQLGSHPLPDIFSIQISVCVCETFIQEIIIAYLASFLNVTGSKYMTHVIYLPRRPTFTELLFCPRHCSKNTLFHVVFTCTV